MAGAFLKPRLLAFCCTGFASAALFSAGPSQAQAPQPKGNCAVCGMHVANFPNWAAVVTFKNGPQAWFDGPKDLFFYVLNLKQYAAKRNANEIEAIQVKDYYGLKHIDARKAFFVLGSDVLGPMGRELVPFASEADAKDFLKDHKGQKILSFLEISPATLKSLE